MLWEILVSDTESPKTLIVVVKNVPFDLRLKTISGNIPEIDNPREFTLLYDMNRVTSRPSKI